MLVPVSETETLRQTVEYAVSRALEDGGGTVRFAFVHAPDATSEDVPAADRDRDLGAAEELLDRAEIWAAEDAGDDADLLTVETSHVGLDQYLFSPEDVARALADELRQAEFDGLVLDPEYDPGVGAPLLRPLESELRELGVSYETAPVTRQIRRGPLLTRSSPLRFAAVFLTSLAFYMILAANPTYWFEWATGLVTATVVAVSMSQISFNRDPDTTSVARLLRHIPYVPFLFWEILKSNVTVTAAILDPRRSIEPRLTRIRPAVYGSLPISVLANSITLTPGTLSVRVEGDSLIVHTLLPSVREDLFDGGLERAVRFVFYGRKAMAIASPLERGDAENLQPSPEDTADDETEGDQ
ncbi:monovalent cation/H+ antiporter subunit E [Halovenus sp. WSH3]|uniref:Monovalent cation/H+ antiporter subunit E n=1 Tax=Halovenus carboxidivorans TaxID=2692199 RepID=A0A6B0TBR7_9EURY|nr:monovalent cation/H+ antiporter subunit E [Halovenus carboxidivorans]MXR53083.1 monovalent cation/H+ antiporter subunit E [Halovenus carboxidivorans]